MIHKMMILVVISILSLVIPGFSQSPGAKPSFEVASIKPNSSARPRIADEPGGRFIATGVPLRMLMGFAYRGPNLQLSGGPGWIESDLWDIEAKAPEGTVAPRIGPPDLSAPDIIALMVQSLLEDRFQLKMHRETKDLPVYELTIAKAGLKLKLSEDQSPPQRPGPGAPRQSGGAIPRGAMRMGRGEIEVTAISFPNLVQTLSQLLGRRVVDKTGLTGYYDVKLQWTPDAFSAAGVGPFGPGGLRGPDPPAPPDASGLSIFTAIEEQLGLKVDSAKGPAEVMVIDSVHKPSQN